MNICINFTPNNFSIGIKYMVAQETGQSWSYGVDWVDDLLDLENYTPGVYFRSDQGSWVECSTCAAHVNMEEVVVYGEKPTNEPNPIDLDESDLWWDTPTLTIPTNDDEWKYWVYSIDTWSEPVTTPVDTTTVIITIESGIDASTVTETTNGILEDILECAGLSALTITSTTRTPESQAQIMYYNCDMHGSVSQKLLYGSYGDQVIDIWIANEGNLTESEVVDLMVAKINALGPTNVSKHCSDPNVLNVIDIAPSSISDKTSFENCVNNNNSVSKFITPPLDQAYHLEITQ